MPDPIMPAIDPMIEPVAAPNRAARRGTKKSGAVAPPERGAAARVRSAQGRRVLPVRRTG